MAYFNRILGIITYYVNVAKQYQVTKSAIYRMDEIINLREVKEGYYKLDSIDNISAIINYSIEGKSLINKLEIKANKGEAILLVGKNGAGKTTLLKILIGTLKINEDSSTIIFNNKLNILDINSFYFRHKALAYVPQKINFGDIKLINVFNEIIPCESWYDLKKILLDKKIPINADIHKLIEEKWDKKVNDLSGGEKQLIAILRAIIKSSTLLILDEPTSNLDHSRILWFKDLIKEIKYDKIIFVISHENLTFDIFDKTIKL